MHRIPLPPALVEAAREYAAGTRTPAEPRNAATVALLRPSPEGVQVYLLRRRASMAFAAGFSVFPGGGVDQRDFDEQVGWAGPPPQAWARALGVDEPLARALVCAAVRETFEESGVLLAGPDADTVVGDTTSLEWEADRVALEARDISLTELLAARGLVLRSDLLGPWSGWLTPAIEPRRYRTWFFVAELPPGQVTRDVSTESAEVTWVGADAVVAGADRGEVAMLPPTYLTCLELAGHPTPAEVISAARGRTVEMFEPLVTQDAEGWTLSSPPWAAALLERHPRTLA